MRSTALSGAFALALAAGLPHAQAESLNVALSAGIQTLDAHNAVVPGTELSVVSQLYTPLVTRDADLKLVGVLAESWELVDPTTWKFVIKPGIKFPDGEPLDAAAVAWNIQRVIDPKTPTRSRSWYTVIDHAEAVSPTELRIYTTQPFGALPEQLTMLFMMAPNWVAANDTTLHAMGTGPYDLVSYTPGDRVVLKAKADYWGPKPDFSDVVMRIIPDAAARVAGLQAGELDVITDILPVDVATINKSGAGQAGALASNKAFVMKFNMTKPPMDNLKLRQAINYAVDKQAIIDSIYAGTTTPSQCQILNSSQIGFNPALKAYAFDPDKARELLKESGLKLPVQIEFEVPLGRYLLAQDAAQAIAGELADVGINVSLKEMEFATWMGKFWDAQDMGQIALLTQFYATNDGGGTLNLFHKSSRVDYWDDDQFSKDLDAARAAIDPVERDRLYAAATSRMCDQAATGFLFGLPATYATSKRVAWKARPDDWVRPADMHLVK
jgi:peptide/nickel transport system substrate-binding protein